MQSTQLTFDRSALILAWLSSRKYRNAHEDLRSYHDAAYAGFSKAFGIDLDSPPAKGSFPDEDGLHRLFLDVAQSYQNIRSPFAGYMCGTREISEVYQKYGKPLEDAAGSTRSLHLILMVELIERIWGGGVPHRISQEELEAGGHPGWNAPDPVDYW